MDWDNASTLEFIQLYENFPVLWNPRHSGHKNRNALNDAWLEISKQLSTKVPVCDLKKKKESLMSTYRTLRKKVVESGPTGTGTEDVYKPSWFAFSAIDRFIRATRTKNKSLNSEDDEDIRIENDHLLTQNEEEPLGDPRTEIDDDNPNKNPDKHSQEGKRKFSAPSTPAMKKKRSIMNQNIEAEVSEHLKVASEALNVIKNRDKKEENTISHPKDACELYGLLLAEKLRKISTRTRLILQNKIDNLVFEAELEEHDSISILVSDRSSSCQSYPSSSYTLQPSPSPSYTVALPSDSPTASYTQLNTCSNSSNSQSLFPQNETTDEAESATSYYNTASIALLNDNTCLN